MKHIKMALYAEPGVGKSTFASKSPNPYFICSDGNFDFLDLPDKHHITVTTWEAAKKAFASIPAWADTVIVDLVEDCFKWCEYEFVNRNKLEHIGDLGYGKGYDITRNAFFIEISKLLAMDKNIILIMHGTSKEVKDRRGVAHTNYVPSPRIPDKLLDQIEGRVRYFIRAYVKGEENENGKIIKKRYLSIVPKENEYGIARGLDEANTPEDIPLDWNIFAKTVGYEYSASSEVEEVKVETKPTTKVTTAPKAEVKAQPTVVTKVETVVEEKVEEEKVEEPQVKNEVKLEETQIKVEVSKPILEPTPKATTNVATSNAPKSAKELQAERIAKLKAMLNK